jgi:hypothetical protein
MISFTTLLDVEAFQRRHRAVISIDTKKKENSGQFKNGGHAKNCLVTDLFLKHP